MVKLQTAMLRQVLAAAMRVRNEPGGVMVASEAVSLAMPDKWAACAC